MKEKIKGILQRPAIECQIRRWTLVFQVYKNKDINYKAASLSYSLLFSMVPLTALVFAIARGFGLDDYIITQIKTFFAYEPQVANLFLGLVDKYLLHAQNSVFIGFGVLLLLYTFAKLLYDIEDVFNQIWHVRKERSIKQKLTNYMCAVVYIPLFLILSSGVSIFFSTSLDRLLPFDSQIWTVSLGWIIPIVLMVLFFASVYVMIPNCKVPFKLALRAAIPVGIGVQLIIYAYIHMQILVTTYNAVYGSFAAIPITMLIVQFVWYLILFGATWMYVRCNEEGLENDPQDMSRTTYHYVMLQLLYILLTNFRDKASGTTIEELEEKMHRKSAFIGNFVDDLEDAGMIHTDDTMYYPSVSPEQCTVAFYMEHILQKGKTMQIEDRTYIRFLSEILHLSYAEELVVELQLDMLPQTVAGK